MRMNHLKYFIPIPPLFVFRKFLQALRSSRHFQFSVASSAMVTWQPIATKYDPLTCGSIDGTDERPHDRAVIRACLAKYKPNKQVQGDPLCTVFVGRLNPETTEDTLQEVFCKYGSIRRLRLVRDIISGMSKRYAFIEFKSSSSARLAATRADQTYIDDRCVFTEMEIERELPGWVPRRLGGGFGGKKESGQLRFGGKDRPFRKPIKLVREEAERKLGHRTQGYVGVTSSHTSSGLTDRQDHTHSRNHERYEDSRQRETHTQDHGYRHHRNDRASSRVDDKRDNKRSYSDTSDRSMSDYRGVSDGRYHKRGSNRDHSNESKEGHYKRGHRGGEEERLSYKRRKRERSRSYSMEDGEIPEGTSANQDYKYRDSPLRDDCERKHKSHKSHKHKSKKKSRRSDRERSHSQN